MTEQVASESYVERQVLFGFRLDAMRIDNVLARCRTALATRQRMMIGVLNAAKVVNARQDDLQRTSLLDCDLLLADGQSVVWASKLLGRPLPERVAGIDLFERLLALADTEGRSVYLLGAKPDILKRLEEVIGERFPKLRIAGSRDGYFKDSENACIAEHIRNSGADMLFLGMTSPKKEIFLGTFGPSLNVPILHGVGGSFDVMAGLTRRAPVAWQRLGMEWAYRLLQEPQRLWWRYLKTNTAFILLTCQELLHPARAFERRPMAKPAGEAL